MARLIDTRMLGEDRVIGAWVHDGLIVDPGPASTVETVLEALGGEAPRALLLTHIHLDHAGAAGTLVRHFPSLRVYVHEAGAPHLADPSRLLGSAARLYGDRMERLWGETLPVPGENLIALGGGESVEGMSVLHTPGHAAHHVSYLAADGAAYVGDVAGVRIPPGEVTVVPTPPPEIDVEAWLGSIRALAAREPQALRLTHFGEVEDAAGQLRAAAESLELIAGWARQEDRERFLARLGELIDAQDPGAAARMRAAMPPDQVWLGLERYWRKKGSS